MLENVKMVKDLIQRQTCVKLLSKEQDQQIKFKFC
jgi:hypothetical protein